jgi:hypothetical protein
LGKKREARWSGSFTLAPSDGDPLTKGADAFARRDILTILIFFSCVLAGKMSIQKRQKGA